MKSSHCEDKQKDRHPDILIDEENGLRIIVLSFGAELISLARISEAGEWNGPVFSPGMGPCWGLTDHHEQRAYEAFNDKEGIQTISSAGELRTCFGMTPQLASFD